MMKKWIFPQLALILVACEGSSEPPVPPEPWSNEAEVLFQDAEVLKYDLERRKAEAARLRDQGLDGVPPMPRR